MDRRGCRVEAAWCTVRASNSTSQLHTALRTATLSMMHQKKLFFYCPDCLNRRSVIFVFQTPESSSAVHTPRPPLHPNSLITLPSLHLFCSPSSPLLSTAMGLFDSFVRCMNRIQVRATTHRSHTTRTPSARVHLPRCDADRYTLQPLQLNVASALRDCERGIWPGIPWCTDCAALPNLDSECTTAEQRLE